MSVKASLVSESTLAAHHLKWTELQARGADSRLKQTEPTKLMPFRVSLHPNLDTDHTRPRTRADCIDGPRPCPYVGCRHHLGLDVREGGSIAYSGAVETCSLDVADEGGLPLLEVGRIIGVTRERIRQIEREALWKLQAAALVSKHLREAMASVR